MSRGGLRESRKCFKISLFDQASLLGQLPLPRPFTSMSSPSAKTPLTLIKTSLMASESTADDEHTPLLDTSAHPESVVPDDGTSATSRDHQVPARVANRLYISHFLSTWNTRVFGFGAVLYLASIFPGTLLPMSVYALTRGASAILFSPAVGQYIDTGNRLQVVRISIGKPFLRLLYYIPLMGS
jgi:hypothetical protein